MPDLHAAFCLFFCVCFLQQVFSQPSTATNYSSSALKPNRPEGTKVQMPNLHAPLPPPSPSLDDPRWHVGHGKVPSPSPPARGGGRIFWMKRIEFPVSLYRGNSGEAVSLSRTPKLFCFWVVVLVCAKNKQKSPIRNQLRSRHL